MIKVDIDKIVEILKEQNAPRSAFVNFMEGIEDPFIVLITCILSLRTKDETTYPASLRLLKLGTKPEDFFKYTVEEIIDAIYPVGFYKNKAKDILQICYTLVNEYDSIVPNTIDELLKFKGVGRKTANLVLARGFGMPAICVDVHVHRICNRLGYVQTKTPDETEMELRSKLPQRYWRDINTLFVTHGQNTCLPIRPKCYECAIAQYCNKNIGR